MARRTARRCRFSILPNECTWRIARRANQTKSIERTGSETMKTDQCDVVVVGFGNAAQAAAYSAYGSGAKVIVLEKAPEAKRGGNTWFSHGAQFRHVHNGIVDEKPLLPN